ncbi:hypothetical protein GMJAKD_00465 [Candidatus Electrothrix aarhusensis]
MNPAIDVLFLVDFSFQCIGRPFWSCWLFLFSVKSDLRYPGCLDRESLSVTLRSKNAPVSYISLSDFFMLLGQQVLVVAYVYIIPYCSIKKRRRQNSKILSFAVYYFLLPRIRMRQIFFLHSVFLVYLYKIMSLQMYVSGEGVEKSLS